MPRKNSVEACRAAGGKACPRCRKFQPLSQFPLKRSYVSGQPYYSECRACLSLASQARYWADPVAARRRDRSRNDNLRQEVFSAYGGKCQCCGLADPEFLTIDHVGGGGTAHRREVKNKVYSFLRRQGYPQGCYRVLCYNCNCAIGLYGYCPHQTGSQETTPDGFRAEQHK
jgi:hypothetical protein